MIVLVMFLAGAGPAQQPIAGAGPAQQTIAGAGPAQQTIAGAGPAQQTIAGAGPAQQLSLDEAISIATRSDPNIARAQSEQERARLRTLRANIDRVRATVDASVTELYVTPSTVLGLSNAIASVQAPLFSGWRVSANIARAEQLERAAAFDIDAERQAVAVSVARAYWSVRRLSLLEDALKDSDLQLAESERLVLARVNSGLAAGLDLNRAAARRAQLDVERQALANQRREASVRLGVLLGIDGDIALTDDPPAADDKLDETNALISRALDARPELRAAELRAASLAEEKRMAESAYWPQLNAGVQAQLGNNPYLAGVGSRSVAGQAFPFSGLTGDVQAGLTLSVNLFDTLQTTHAVEDVEHRERGAAADLRALRREIESNVRLGHARVQSLLEQRAVLVKAQKIVEDNVGILERAYSRGEVLLTELLDAQVELASAARQIVDVDAQLALARIELKAAVGEAQ